MTPLPNEQGTTAERTAKRTVCVVTGSRAEYGLLYWLMHEILEHPRLNLQIVATGMHLSPAFGLTYRQIESDGFVIDAKVDLQMSGDSPQEVTRSVGIGMIGFGETFERLRPDVLVLLGDRFELLAASTAAMIAGIPIAHIHGGEITEGAIDDAIRHAITKMSQLHFVAAAPYRDRVIQLGEAPERVFVVGGAGLDNIERLQLLSRDELSRQLDFDLTEPYFLVTYHPVTLASSDDPAILSALLAALDAQYDCKIVITGVNADPGHASVARLIANFAKDRADRVLLVQTLGQIGYLSAAKYCIAVVGNSSSGLVEAPALHVPTVNIGLRQSGRLRAKSVIDCAETKEDIENALLKTRSVAFREICSVVENPYGESGAAERITNTLATVALESLRRKQFYDLPFTEVMQP
jgi:UDP-hydrolysing UDP-N-acetyl-D-glucosamine 2-epimerase